MDIQNNQIYQSDIIRACQMVLPWEKLSDKNILISGATGMIASVIIDILMMRNKVNHQNIHIYAISRNRQRAKERFSADWSKKEFKWWPHDINLPLTECGKMDYILHAASNTHPRAYAEDPIGTITANVQGTYHLLQYASLHDCKRFFFFSSVEIYGENRGDVEQFDEKYMGYIDCNSMRAGYPESKRLGEAFCNAFAVQKGIDFIIGRFSRIYGPTMGKEDSKAIAQFIRNAVLGQDIVLKSEGNQLYSYTYVVDAAMAVLCLLLKGESRSAVNIVDSHSNITLKELAEILAHESGTNVIFALPNEKEKAGYSTATKAVLDGTRLEELGWQAFSPIDQGVRKTVQILRQLKSQMKEHVE